jgi:hypothetical protein
VQAPTCRVDEVLRRAGAPQEGRASVRYEAEAYEEWFMARQKAGYKAPFDVDKPQKGVWVVTVREGAKVVVMKKVPDDC